MKRSKIGAFLFEPATAIASIVALGAWSGYARALVGSPLLAVAMDVALATLFVVVLARVGRHLPRITFVDLLIGLYFLLALVQVMNPNVPSLVVGAEGFRKTGAMIVGYWIVRLAGSTRLLDFLIASAVGLIPALLMGVRQFVFPWPIDRRLIEGSGVAETTFLQAGQLRAFAPTSGPFHLGAVSAFAGIAASWLAFDLPQHRRRWLIVASLAALTLLLTITRANWLATLGALATGTAIVIVVTGRVRRAARLAALVSVVVLALALVVPPLVASHPTGDRWLFYFRSLTAPLDARNVQFRLQYWSDYITAISERPLIGYGTSSAADGFRMEYAGTDSHYFPPHSIYFKAALEMGVAGLALLIAILLVAGYYGLRLARGHPALSAIVCGTIAFVAVSGVSGPMLDAYPFNLIVWTLIGFTVNLVELPVVPGSPIGQGAT